MNKHSNQPELFADKQVINKEDTMDHIVKLNELSKKLKYMPFGILHPDRLKDQDFNAKTTLSGESFNETEKNNNK